MSETENQAAPAAQPQAPQIPRGTKFAMTISSDDRFKPMGQWDIRLDDRADCETDLTRLQVLPYFIISDTAGNLFVYDRPTTGTETRLHGLTSCGLGGHVDTIPSLKADATEDMRAYFTLVHLAVEGARELREEAGLSVPLEVLVEALKNAMLIYTPVDSVNAVHLALAAHITVQSRSELTKFEQTELINPRWMPLHKFVQREQLDGVLNPEAFAFEAEVWTRVWTTVNQSHATREHYDQNWQRLCKEFATLRAIVSDARDACDGIPSAPHLSMAEYEGRMVLAAQRGRNGELVRFGLPDASHVDKVAYNAETREMSFIYDNGVVKSTTDFVRWDTYQPTKDEG